MKRPQAPATPATRGRRTAAGVALAAVIAIALGVVVVRRGRDAARPRPGAASTVSPSPSAPSPVGPVTSSPPPAAEPDGGPEPIPPDPRRREEKVTNEPLVPRPAEPIREQDPSTFPPERREKRTNEPLVPPPPVRR